MRAIDPIDRIALMEKLGIGKECTVCEQNSDPFCKWKPDVVDVCEAICTAPTIESQRKKGKWIYLDKDKRFFHPHIVKCSVCNNTLDMYGVNAGRGDANFCPNCGARMEGQE